MATYRKLVEQVEAVLFGDYAYGVDPKTSMPETPQWLTDAFTDGTVKPEFRSEDHWYMMITLPGTEGIQKCGPNTYIVKYSDGTIRGVKSTKFLDEYELV